MASPRSPSLTGSIATRINKSSGKEHSSIANMSGSTAHLTSKEAKDRLEVDNYYGDRSKLRTYVVQLQLAFTMKSSQFLDGGSKVLFAATCLKGAAFT